MHTCSKSFYLACKKGFFGRNCSFVCSLHCKTCRHTDGYCGCFDGYTGYNCNTGILYNKKCIFKKNCEGQLVFIFIQKCSIYINKTKIFYVNGNVAYA